MEKRQGSVSSVHAAPQLKNALGGANEPATPHDFPPPNVKGRRTSVNSLLRAPTMLSEALEQWENSDVARAKLYDSRLEATFEDGKEEEEEEQQDDLEKTSTIHSLPPKPVDKKRGGQGPERDPFLVTWESTNSEKENPRTWSYWYKVRVLALYAIFGGVGPWVSSMVSSASNIIGEELHFKSSTEQNLMIAIFLLAFVFGPLIAAPISEAVGRRLVVLVCNVLFIVFNISCAVSQTSTQMIVLRFFTGFFGGAMIPIGGGCVTDLFEPHQRGQTMAMYSIMPVLGPCLAPVVSGWIIQGWGEDRWRWIFWTSTFFAVAVQVTGMLFTRESYAPVLLKVKATRLRKDTGDQRYHTIFEKKSESLSEKAQRILLRPVIFITTEPVVLFPGLYMSIVYGCFYLLIAALPRVFQGIYQFPVGIASMHNLALGVGLIICGQIEGYIIDVLYRKMCKWKGNARPEYKLPMLMVLVFVTPSGLLLFGWTAFYHKIWIAPDIGLAMVGAALVGTTLQVQMYMADLMGIYSASAISATLALRSLFGFAFCLIAEPLYNKLDVNWGSSVLALICAIFGIPAPFLLYRFGATLRRRSKYCIKDED